MKLPDWVWIDEVTWVGHFLQGVAVAFVFDLLGLNLWGAFLALLFHFGIREGSEFYFGNVTTKKKLKDTVLDFVTPFLGLGIVALAAWILS